jgi:hypothetical protein
VTCGVLALLAGKKKYDSLFTGWDDAPLPGPDHREARLLRHALHFMS